MIDTVARASSSVTTSDEQVAAAEPEVEDDDLSHTMFTVPF